MTRNSSSGQKIYRLALYGVRSSGKTCILAALSLPRFPHPDKLSCSWIENADEPTSPSGNQQTPNRSDPVRAASKWLQEQRTRLRRGELPRANPVSEGAMKFIFDFGAPHQGTRRVELIDYSGELITASANELAAQLREHMRHCDGLLILAEVPPQSRECGVLAEDLEKLKAAFLVLLKERDSSSQTDWPIALLFNKWDRRGNQIDFSNRSPTQVVDEFLKAAPLHSSLVQTLHNAAGKDNVRCFAVSAFGAHKVREDGAEAPVLDGGLLKSWRLEDGFVWVMDRVDELEVEGLEHAAKRAKWWAFWQPLIGRWKVVDFYRFPRLQQSFRGVSPCAAIYAGLKLLPRFPKSSEFRKRTSVTLGVLRRKLASQIVTFWVFLYASLILGFTGYDAMRYRSVVVTESKTDSTEEQILNAEIWLDKYYKAPTYLRWLSYWMVLSREEAFSLLTELTTRRDDMLWEQVSGASPSGKVSAAQKYLKFFPVQGRHTQEALGIVETANHQENLDKNKSYLKDLEKKLQLLIVNTDTRLSDLNALSHEVDALPYPDARSDKLEEQQQKLRTQISQKISEVAQLQRLAAWEKFRQTYIALIGDGNIQQAARLLVERQPTEPDQQQLMQLKQDFQKRAPPIIRQKVDDFLKYRRFEDARKAAQLRADPNVAELLPPAVITELAALDEKINEAVDLDLYSQIIKYKPQCNDQITAYLTKAPLKTMQQEVHKYQRSLADMEGPLNLTLKLSAVQWHNHYYSSFYTYRNKIDVFLAGKHLVTVPEVVSKPNGVSKDLGEATFRAYLNDTITIKVDVVAKYGALWDSTMPGGSGSWTGTPNQLRSGVTIDLNGDGFTNRATFAIEGIPPEPPLPDWRKR